MDRRDDGEERTMTGEWWRCGACGGAGTTTRAGHLEAEVTFDHRPGCPHLPQTPAAQDAELTDDEENDR